LDEENKDEGNPKDSRGSHGRLHVQARQGIYCRNPVEIQGAQAAPFRE